MAKKISDEECRKNYFNVCDLFKKVVSNSERFNVVYACGVDVGMSDFIVVRKTTYTYSSYAVGYDASANEIAVLPIDIDLENYGAPVYLPNKDVIKAKQSWLSKEITIRADKLPKKYIQLMVQEQINQDEDNVVICVKQNEEAKNFIAFFKNKYAK